MHSAGPKSSAEGETEMTHWLILFKRKFVSQHSTRRLAENAAIQKYALETVFAAKLRANLVVSLPRIGMLEIVSCDCTDGEHKEETVFVIN